MAETAVTAHIGTTNYQVQFDDGTHTWFADEPASLGGGDRGPSPFSLLLSSLGACTAITVRMFAEHRGWPLTGAKVHLEFNPEGSPTEGTDIRRKITLQGDLSPEQRERLLDVANKCPLHKVLTGEIRLYSSLTPP